MLHPRVTPYKYANWPDDDSLCRSLWYLDGDVKINPKELEMAKALIESLADTFDPSRDEYRQMEGRPAKRSLW